MDPEASTESVFVSYIKSHPFVPISLVLSAGALFFGAASLSRSSFSITPEVIEVVENTSFKIAVDVEGEVLRPGLIEIELDDSQDLRVADVLEAAGGLLPTADRDYVQHNLNLAALVTDGMKLYVPKKGAEPAVSTQGSTNQKTNVNSASVSDLTKLKGIGEARAQSLVANRPYTSLEDLKAKSKIPASVIEEIKDDLSF